MPFLEVIRLFILNPSNSGCNTGIWSCFGWWFHIGYDNGKLAIFSSIEQSEVTEQTHSMKLCTEAAKDRRRWSDSWAWVPTGMWPWDESGSQLAMWPWGCLFIHAFIQQVFLKHLLCARHSSRCWGCVLRNTKSQPSWIWHSMGEQKGKDNKISSNIISVNGDEVNNTSRVARAWFRDCERTSFGPCGWEGRFWLLERPTLFGEWFLSSIKVSFCVVDLQAYLFTDSFPPHRRWTAFSVSTF